MKTQIPLLAALSRYFELPIPEPNDGILDVPNAYTLSIPPLFPVIPGIAGIPVNEGAFSTSSLDIPASQPAGDILIYTLTKGLYYLQYGLSATFGLAAVAANAPVNLFLNDPVSLRGFVIASISRQAALAGGQFSGSVWLPLLTAGWQIRVSTPATAAGDFVNGRLGTMISRVG